MLQSWLGLERVDRAALWALFFAWGISVIQVLPYVCLQLSLPDFRLSKQADSSYRD
jgi:hypothetical protein